MITPDSLGLLFSKKKLKQVDEGVPVREVSKY
jgi:hypothetical protein